VGNLRETESYQIHLETDQLPRLSKKAGSTILGLIKEAAFNARKHAQAANLWIAVRRQQDILEVSVRDDGRGFDFDAEAILAQNRARDQDPGNDIRSRVEVIQGDLSIDSAVGKGTTLHATVPLSNNLA
jgi:two-component system sensor histidine kinase DegS